MPIDENRYWNDPYYRLEVAEKKRFDSWQAEHNKQKAVKLNTNRSTSTSSSTLPFAGIDHSKSQYTPPWKEKYRLFRKFDFWVHKQIKVWHRVLVGLLFAPVGIFLLPLEGENAAAVSALAGSVFGFFFLPMLAGLTLWLEDIIFDIGKGVTDFISGTYEFLKKILPWSILAFLCVVALQYFGLIEL